MKKILHELNESHHQLKNMKVMNEKQLTELEYELHKERKLNKELKNRLYNDNEVYQLESQELIENLKRELQFTKLNYEERLRETESEVERKEEIIDRQKDKITKLYEESTKIKIKYRHDESTIERDEKEIEGLNKLI